MKLHATRLLHSARRTMIGFAILLTTCFAAISAQAQPIDLGLASNYVVLNPGALGSPLNSNTSLASGTINGNVGQGPRAGWPVFVGARINGRVDNGGSSFPGFTGSGTATGGVFTTNMTGPSTAAVNASAAAAALTPTQQFTSLTNGQVISGGIGLNVIRVNNPLSLTNPSSLILNGNPFSQFVFQLAGAGANSLNNVTMNLLGGVAPANILWDLNGIGGALTINSGTEFGTFLAPFRNVTVSGGAQLVGRVIGGGGTTGVVGSNTLTISGAATTVTLAPPAPEIPEPGTLTMMGTGMIGILGAVRRRLRRT